MQTFICVASGPSLTQEDCITAAASGFPIIAVNSSWQRVPDCQHLYANDRQWWDKHHADVSCTAKKWTSVQGVASRYGLSFFPSPLKGSFNSGQRAILLAKHLGAEQILLLGYDCSIEHGTHWHGNHDAGLKNPTKNNIIRWKEQFARLAKSLPAETVINCSRHTELVAFPCGTLEEAMQNGL